MVQIKFKIEPHEFNKNIVFYRKCESIKDEDGIPGSDKEIELCKARAKVTNIRGSEYIQSLGDVVAITTKIYIRYKRNIEITEEDIVLYKSNRYNIKYINNIDEANVFLELLVERVK